MKSFIFLLISLCSIISILPAMEVGPKIELHYVGAPCLNNMPSELKNAILVSIERDIEDLFRLSQTSNSMQNFFKITPVHLNLTYLSSDRELRDADLKRYVTQFPRAISLDLNILFLTMNGIGLLDGLPDLKSLHMICQYNGHLPETKRRAQEYASGGRKSYYSSLADSVLSLEEIQYNSPAFYSHDEDKARDAQTPEEFVQEMEVRRLIGCDFWILLFFNLDKALVSNITHYSLVRSCFKTNPPVMALYLEKRLEIKNIASKMELISHSHIKRKNILGMEIIQKINSFCFFGQLEHLSLPVFVDQPFGKDHSKLVSLDISKNCSPSSTISPLGLNSFLKAPLLSLLKIQSGCIMSCAKKPLSFIDDLKNLKELVLFYDKKYPVCKDIIDQLDILRKDRTEFRYTIIEEDVRVN